MGELAALLTAVFWAASSIIFTFAGRRVGAPRLNRLRLIFAILWITITHWFMRGTPLPVDADLTRWGWLGLSGVIGLALGDLFLFTAYVNIGPRLSTLIMASSPVMTAVLSWLLLGETLRPTQMGGIALTLSGIAWVVLERGNGSGAHLDRRTFLVGLLAGLGGAVCQTVGLLLTKQGLTGDYPSISGVAIRMIAATVTLWLAALITGQAGPTLAELRDRVTLRLMLAGSLVGPFAGIWLSLVAIQNAPVGVASTLMQISPILLLPAGKWIFKEHISPRAVLGTLVSLAGVLVLILL